MTEPSTQGARNILANMGFDTSFFNKQTRKNAEERVKYNKLRRLLDKINNETIESADRLADRAFMLKPSYANESADRLADRAFMLKENTPPSYALEENTPPSYALEENLRPLGLRLRLGQSRKRLGPNTTAKTQKKREYNARSVEPPQTMDEINRIWAKQKANMKKRHNGYERYMLKQREEEATRRERQRERMNRYRLNAEEELGPDASPEQIRAEIQKKLDYNALPYNEKERIRGEQINRIRAKIKANREKMQNDYERRMLKQREENAKQRKIDAMIASARMNKIRRNRKYKTLKRQNGQRNLFVNPTVKKPWFKFW